MAKRAKRENPHEPPPWLKRLRRHLKEKGIRVTPQRMEIYRLIHGSTEHPSAEDVFKEIKKKIPSISLDTVYRTLSLFEEIGLVKRVHLLSDHARFDPRTSQHHHFVCTECKRIIDFSWHTLDLMPPPKEELEGAEISMVQAEVRGICPACLNKRKKG